jgi:alkanesulfonate monooxygenase SsuD/methylene tetrahydromethanopterin reductase-like flavin-dependent oxidoreductase (luciferase family)
MRFGLTFGFVTPSDAALTWRAAARDFVRGARLAEELGYDTVSVVEHHFQPDGYLPSPLVALAAAAGVTERVRLETNILLVPLYQPVKLAEDIAVLDNLCGGRLTLGVAPGYVTEEFAGMEIPYIERFRRFEEALDLMQLAWTRETFSFDGEFFHVPETALTPKPVQSPHPPIRYGVSGPRLLRRAARRHAVLTASPRHTVAELSEHFRIYEAAAAEHGFSPTERPAMREVYIAETRTEAERLADPAVTHLFRELYGRKSAAGERALRSDDGALIEDMDRVDFATFKGRYIIGTPDDAIERLTELRDELGVTEVSCWMHLPGLSGADAERSARLFASEVIPALADEPAPATTRSPR